MSQFTFIVQVPVNLITTVEATSLEDAIHLVSKQAVKRLCPCCENEADDDGQWVITSSVQEDPMNGQLMDCMVQSNEPRIGRTEADRMLLKDARIKWARS